MDYGCPQTKEEIIEYYKQSGAELPDYLKEPPMENASFNIALKFLKKGFKIKRESYFYWLVLNEEQNAVYYEQDVAEPWNEFEFDYSDVIATDWLVEKIKE